MQLLDVGPPHQARSPKPGLRNNLSVGFQYISFWLGGRGAAAINSLMEDAATAEISRSQIWQWIHHGVTLPDGRTINRQLVSSMLDEELARIRADVGEEDGPPGTPRRPVRCSSRLHSATSCPSS